MGWDGADWAIIEEAWRRGRLETLRSLAESGQRGVLTSTIPPLTPAAWTSFFTGAGPGEHGIFDFASRSPDDYQLRLVPGGARRVPTLMARLDSAGYRTIQVTVPWTYPAEELEHGAIVPGWDAPNETFETAHPPNLAEELARSVRRVPRGTDISAARPRGVLRQQRESLRLRVEMSKLLWSRVDPDVFMIVFPEPDNAAHRLWRKGEVPASLIDAYEQVDNATGRLLRAVAREEDTILVVSDHGSKPIHTFVNLAPILESGGWLRRPEPLTVRRNIPRAAILRTWHRLPGGLRTRIVRSLPGRYRERLTRRGTAPVADWPKTSAFPSGTGLASAGVHIHTRPPFRLGWVSEDEYEVVRERLVARLSSMVDPATGQPVFSLVARREDVYSGRATSLAPDLVVVGSDGYGVRPGLQGRQPELSRTEFGGHGEEGIFVVSPSLGLAGTEQIERILPGVLQSLGFEVTTAIPDAGQGTAASAGTGTVSFSQRETEEIESRLRDLGYIE